MPSENHKKREKQPSFSSKEADTTAHTATSLEQKVPENIMQAIIHIIWRGSTRRRNILLLVLVVASTTCGAWFALPDTIKTNLLNQWMTTPNGSTPAHQQPNGQQSFEPLNGQQLIGPSAINTAIESIAETGSKRIQLLIQVLGAKPHLPESLAEIIASRIEYTNSQGLPIQYDPILMLDPDNPPPGFIEVVARRVDVFSKKNVSQFVRPRFLTKKFNIGMDVLIVDRTHLLILLNTVPLSDSMQVGFLFRDQPKMASEFSDWFDQVLLPNSEYLDSWLKTRNMPTKKIIH